ncbi:hypothetical protein RHO15_06630 [Utexia brackfieldae]|uniref:hypothetical protein n=1 Tax=Utexia brackfieldae TaxID=3074108 RepID=UPI00370DD9AA
MPYVGGIGLSTIIAILFAIHVFKTGQDRYWLFILLIFPFLGSIIYAVVVFLPSLRQSRSGYQIEANLRKTFNASKELRDAEREFQLSPTIDARLRYANALLEAGKAAESLEHYQIILTGVYQDAPDILLAYAYALFDAAQYDQAKAMLSKLKQQHIHYHAEEILLLYARTLVKLNQSDEAKAVFVSLTENQYASIETYVCYAQALIDWDDKTAAAEQLTALDERVRFLPKHAKQLNAKWLKQANELRRQLR